MKKPKRRCIGCGQIKDQEELLRFTFDGENLVREVNKTNSGRSAYLCNTDKCLELALKNKAFSRALKVEISSEHIGRCFNDR